MTDREVFIKALREVLEEMIENGKSSGWMVPAL
jgi:hypothetical protein